MNELVRRLSSSLVATLALVAFAGGCSSSTDDPREVSGATADDLSKPALRACPAAARYAVIEFQGQGLARCPDVAGVGGTWRAPAPTACIPTTAPTDSRPFLCLYDWA